MQHPAESCGIFRDWQEMLEEDQAETHKVVLQCFLVRKLLARLFQQQSEYSGVQLMLLIKAFYEYLWHSNPTVFLVWSQHINPLDAQ